MKRVVLDWLDSRYEARLDGRIVSYVKSAKGRTLKPDMNSTGYLRVTLQVDGEDKRFFVHRLILRAFTGVEGEQCNHLDGDRENNSFSNLAWCSASENQKHSYAQLGKQPTRSMQGKKGSAHNRSRGIEQRTVEGALVRAWSSLAEAKAAGFEHSSISKVCSGKRKTHGGFAWQYSQQGV